jgi:hypothetical protein
MLSLQLARLVRSFSAVVPRTLPLYKRSMIALQSGGMQLVTRSEIPSLVRRPDNLLVEQWHRVSAFPPETELLLPVRRWQTGEYSGQCLPLDPLIFNLPLRRDIVHRVQVYESKKGKVNLIVSKTLATVTSVLPRLLTPTRRSGLRKDQARLV